MYEELTPTLSDPIRTIVSYQQFKLIGVQKRDFVDLSYFTKIYCNLPVSIFVPQPVF